MKIKITNEVKEYEGTVTEKIVTPFGNSAHISVGKKHTGKIIPMVVPSNPKYKWVLPIMVLKKVETECNKILAKEDGKMVHFQRQAVGNLADVFSVEDLNKVIKILEQEKKNNSLIKHIKNTYEI